MVDGYIKLYRQITDNPFWKEKPFSRGQAWIDLLLKANFSDREVILKGQIVEVKRGQLIRGVDSLAEEWGWSRNKVRRFLDVLEAKRMCTKSGTPNGTLITIEKYAFFQDGWPPNDTPNEPPDEPPNEPPDEPRYKKVKESKKKVKNIGGFAPPALDDVSKYVKDMGYSMDPAAFYDYYTDTNWIRKNGQKIKDWKSAVRMWESREKQFRRTEPERSAIEPPKYAELKPDPDPEKTNPERGPVTGMPEDVRKKVDELFS